ncbi:MAG: response regulator [Candidatus Wallbacteria bacterium]|nr:response regulator [Candidatus Wallbacteria bacterium]
MKDSILVVDDNQYERSLVTRALAKLSATCVLRQAASAEEALDAVKEQPPSVALMDCRLPGISGIEALRQLRASGHGFPIIMCTAEDARDSVIEALRAGASDYLVKDKNFFEMLPIAVDKALGLHRLEQEKATILERLRQGKDRYERLVIHAHDIMFQVDSKGRFLYVNPALEGDLGHRPEELYDDPELACRLVHPEDPKSSTTIPSWPADWCTPRFASAPGPSGRGCSNPVARRPSSSEWSRAGSACAGTNCSFSPPGQPPATCCRESPETSPRAGSWLTSSSARSPSSNRPTRSCSKSIASRASSSLPSATSCAHR